MLKYLLDSNFKVRLSEFDEIWAVRYFTQFHRNPTYDEQCIEHKNIILDFIEKNSNMNHILDRIYKLGRSKQFLDRIFNEDLLRLNIKINIINNI